MVRVAGSCLNLQKMAAAPPDSEQNGQNGQDSVMKEQQRKIQQLYGGLPKKTVVNRAPTGQRKYFDS